MNIMNMWSLSSGLVLKNVCFYFFLYCVSLCLSVHGLRVWH